MISVVLETMWEFRAACAGFCLVFVVGGLCSYFGKVGPFSEVAK